MNILILGGGGREHALAWAVLQNPKCDRLIVAPGNAGIAKSRNVRILIFSTMLNCSRSARKTAFLS
jgi:phosphoribosylamine-glycine ligase